MEVWQANSVSILTILNTQQNSDYLDFRSQGRHGLWGIGISNLESAFDGMIYIEVYVKDFTETPVRLQSNGNDIEINANKALILNPFPFIGMRIVSSSVETQDRTFKIIGIAR